MHDAPAGNTLHVFARHALVGPTLREDVPAVLLEGAWPEGASSEFRPSLDEAVDARFGWVDEEASRLAGQLAESPPAAAEADSGFFPNAPAWLNALGLRYHLVKLIRLVAYFTEVRPLRSGQSVHLAAARDRDEGYADCIAEICRLAAARLQVAWVDRPEPPAQRFPANGPWRRAAARLSRLWEPRFSDSSSPRRVVLCGNAGLLDPVCRELLRRGCRVWWLYDRFAMKAWLRWRAAGVGQLVCESDRGRVNRLFQPTPPSLLCRGVDLARPVERWIAERVGTHGARQTWIVEQIDAHFGRLRPHVVVLDEDATPMARATVWLARQHAAVSLVVQHGAPLCRFGFAPPAADQILLWGQSSQRQLIRWGVPAERMGIVGSPRHDPSGAGAPGARLGRLQARVPSQRNDAPRILLLTTVPPRDDRPDAVALRLTRQTYVGMVRAAFAAVAAIPGARLAVKLHPRAPGDPIVRAALSDFPTVASRVVTRGPLERWLRWADCVLSCVSSAGVDAALTGVPVLQLLPPGSEDVLPHRQWGMFGTARSEAELRALLVQALDAGRKPAGAVNRNVFAELGGAAAARIADVVLAAGEAPQPVEAPPRVPAGSVEGAGQRARSSGVRVLSESP